MRTLGVFIAGIAGLAGPAVGQDGWLFDVQYSDPAGVINSLDDTATVTLWAGFDQKYYAFEGAKLDVGAEDPLGAGLWSDPQEILGGDWAMDGVIDGEVVRDIVTRQLQGIGGLYADTSNPIAVWTATWRTDELSARSVMLLTETDEFGVYTEFDGDWKDLTDVVEEGVGGISVLPAPGAAPCLPLLAGMTRRARRKR